MINTAYPIDAVVTWDESFVPDGAQKFPWCLVLLTNLLNLWWNKTIFIQSETTRPDSLVRQSDSWGW